MDEQRLIEDLLSFCAGVDAYLVAYDSVLQVIGDDITPDQTEELTARLCATRDPLSKAGEILAEVFYERGDGEPGNIVTAIIQELGRHRNGYETLRCEWPQWKFLLGQTGRRLRGSLMQQEHTFA